MEIQEKIRKVIEKNSVMLFGEDFRRRHQQCVVAALERAEDCNGGDDRFAGTDIALEQAAHGMFAAEIGFDLEWHRALSVGELKAQLFQEGCGQFAVTAAGQGGGVGVEVYPAAAKLALELYKFIEGQSPPRLGGVFQFVGKM